MHGCQTSPRPAEPPGDNTVTSCATRLVCGYGNSLALLETGISCIVLPTTAGLLRNAKVSAFLSAAGPLRVNPGLRLRFPSQPAQHRHVARAQKTHFK